jgi:hypothetical protein
VAAVPSGPWIPPPLYKFNLTVKFERKLSLGKQVEFGVTVVRQIFKKQRVNMWTGFVWLRKWCNEGVI